jgi:hypothetical protein
MFYEKAPIIRRSISTLLCAGGVVGALFGANHLEAEAQHNFSAATKTQTAIYEGLPASDESLVSRLNQVNAILSKGAEKNDVGQYLTQVSKDLTGQITAIALHQGKWSVVAKAQAERAAGEAASQDSIYPVIPAMISLLGAAAGVGATGMAIQENWDGTFKPRIKRRSRSR